MVADRELPGRSLWSILVGPLLTLLLCVALWAVAYFGVIALDPVPFLCLAVAFCALRGRITSGLIGVALALAYVGVAAPYAGAPTPTVIGVLILGTILVSLVFLISSSVEWLSARVETALSAAATAERRSALVTSDASRRADETGEIGRLYEDLRRTATDNSAALELLEAALDSVAQGVAIVDQQTNLVWWNRSLATMTGVALGDRGRGDELRPAASFLDPALVARTQDHGETVTRLGTMPDGRGGEKAYVEQYSPVDTVRGGRFVAVTVAQVMANGNGATPPAPAPPAAKPGEPLVFDPDVIDTLRAPLAAIREYVWFMVAGPDEPRRRANDEYGSRVLGAAQQMDDRIQALLEYSHVLRGPVKLDEVQLDEVVRDALQSLEPGLSTSGARVRIVAQPAPGPVTGDRQLLTLAVTHLIGNAIKYVPADVPPRVLLWLEQVDGRARLSVEDNGIGIAAGQERRLFRLFERLPEAEAYPGNGVGLAVVRAAVERMGGRLGLQSEPGWGSRFWIELPESTGAARPALAEAARAESVPLLSELPPPTRPEGSSFAGIGEQEWRPI